MQPLIAAVIGFIVVLAVVIIIGYLATQRSVATRERLTRYTTTATPSATAPAQRTQSVDMLPGVTKFLSSRGFTEKLIMELQRAGMKWRPSEFAVVVAACAFAPMLAFFVVRASLWMVLLAGIVGFLVPVTIVRAKQQLRLKAFNEQIADALSLMASSLRSGYSFMRAMQVVANEMPNPISEEFSRVIDECNVGVPTEDALSHLVERVQSYDMELVATAVTIQIQLGGNLAEILDTIAETIRERVRINGEVAALTADGRLSGVILIALPIFLALVIYLIRPGYLEPLVQERTGQILLVSASLSMVVGALTIRRMLRIDF